MTDLHTHILPGMDDGPKDLGAALELLEQARQQGIGSIALTSHYPCGQELPEEFLARRELAFAALAEQCAAGLKLKRGCEVYFSPQLLTFDPRPLCLEGTDLLLLELPVLQKPAFLREVLTALQQQGIVPLIAHAERYLYVQRDPRILGDWISLGAYIQVNAHSVTDGGFARKLIKWGLCQVIASDAHSIRHRPVNLKAAMDTVSRRLGPGKARMLEENAAALFSGEPLRRDPVHVPRKLLGHWL